MAAFDPKFPYNDLPSLPPPIDLIETKGIFKKCISARVALAELKQAAELIPNSAVLVNALPLLEARASSEIENIVTTTDKLFEFVDIAGLVKGANEGEGLGNQFLANIRETDAVAQVVRCFEDDDVTHVSGGIDPLRDIGVINTELVLSDLEQIESRVVLDAEDLVRHRWGHQSRGRHGHHQQQRHPCLRPCPWERHHL